MIKGMVDDFADGFAVDGRRVGEVEPLPIVHRNRHADGDLTTIGDGRH